MTWEEKGLIQSSDHVLFRHRSEVVEVDALGSKRRADMSWDESVIEVWGNRQF